MGSFKVALCQPTWNAAPPPELCNGRRNRVMNCCGGDANAGEVEATEKY